MNLQTSGEPPEMVAASEEPVRLVGDPVTVDIRVPASAQETLRRAVQARGKRLMSMNVEDIQAESNPGVVYGVYLNRPPDMSANEADEYHIGNIALFGIERMNDPDAPHQGVPGFRHTFDVTRHVTSQHDRGDWNNEQIRILIEPLFPQPPPGREDAMEEVVAQQRRWAAESPVVIGRVSLFVS
jgi:hypothetical protein